MPKDSDEKQGEFIAAARQRFSEAASDEKSIRDAALYRLKYVAGDQWDDASKVKRQGRPCLTFNRCHTFVQTVSNEARQQKPQFRFSPAEENDKDTAEIYEGLARHIQYDSDAQVAYETAVEYSAGGGFGFFRYLTEYHDDESFDQDLKIVPVFDPFAVYGVLIPSCFGMEPQFAFIIEDIPLAEFKRQYPKSAIHDFDTATAEKMSEGWISTETVRVAEYWYIEYEDKVLAKGEQTRKVQIPTVKFCKMNGLEVLPDSETTWPGYCIPIVPVLGKQIIIDGKPQLFSVVSFQLDAQNLINYYKSRIAETLNVAPIQPYLLPKGSVAEEDKPRWAAMNTGLWPYLEYEIMAPDGKPLPAPTRQVFEPPIGSLSNASAQEIDDMKATAGIFDASLGARSNEQSGYAIARRQSQANVTNMHFLDNLGRAFNKGGEIFLDVVRKIYDSARIIRILGTDEAPRLVKINQMNGDGKHYKLGGKDVGKYDLVVTMGRSFSTKRMESFDMMSEIIKSNEALLPIIGDILFANSDFAGADILAERFRKQLPPNLQDNKDQIPPQAQQAIEQSKQQLQALNAYAQQLEKEKADLEQKLAAKVADNAAKLEIVKMQEETKILIAEITTKAQESKLRMEMEQEVWRELHGSGHELGMAAVQQGHEQDMAAQQAQQADQNQPEAPQ